MPLAGEKQHVRQRFQTKINRYNKDLGTSATPVSNLVNDKLQYTDSELR